MDLREIERLLIDNEENNAGKDWNSDALLPESWNDIHYEFSQPFTVPGLGVVTNVYSEGGGEGSGEHVEVVLRVEPPMTDYNESLVRYFRKTGYYSSYEGTVWDGAFEEVEPRKVTVTQYFAV